MLPLFLGLAIFIGIHLVPTQPQMRRGLASRFGEGAWKGVFSLIALAGFVLIVAGYHKIQVHPGKNPQIWSPPAWGRHATLTLMLTVFPLLIEAYLPGRIAALVRHPMITAVTIWACAHLLVRGDLASLLLFGGFLAWSVYAHLSMRAREAAGGHRRAAGAWINDVIAIVLGLGAYVVFLKWGHPALIGVPLLP